MTDRELMQMALDALDEAQDYTSCPTYSPSMTQQCATAAVALRARLAQPVPEPVATLWQHGETGRTRIVMNGDITDCGANWILVSDLYTAPPQREWQGLTRDEVSQIWSIIESEGDVMHEVQKFARAIEAKLKEKNG